MPRYFSLLYSLFREIWKMWLMNLWIYCAKVFPWSCWRLNLDSVLTTLITSGQLYLWKTWGNRTANVIKTGRLARRHSELVCPCLVSFSVISLNFHADTGSEEPTEKSNKLLEHLRKQKFIFDFLLLRCFSGGLGTAEWIASSRW